MLVICDYDETLFTSLEANYLTWQELFANRGCEPLRSIEEFVDLIPRWVEFLRSLRLDLAGLNEDFANMGEPIFAEHADWADGALELLHTLRDAGHVCAGVTNNRMDLFDKFFEDAGLSDIPGYDPHLTHPGKFKPEPDMLLDHMHNLGFSAEETIMVGDSPSDLEAAQKAKVRGFWAGYTTFYHPIQVSGFGPASHRLKSPLDLLAHI